MIVKGIALLLTATICHYSIAQDEIVPATVSLTSQDKAMMAWVEQHQDNIFAELKIHVEMNTGTDNIKGIDRYRAVLAKNLHELGFETEEHSAPAVDILTCKGGQMAFADNLVGRLRGSASNRIFLNGHMDTVFSASDEFQTLAMKDADTMHGPGVGDMKGGNVILLNALRALKAQGFLKDAHMTVLFNSDEEIGSLGSRSLVEELAKQHDVGFVFEGSYKGLMTRSRKGLGQARLKITGRESHAGVAHQNGVSANLEMAHKIIAIEKLTNYEEKSTVNVGVMAGGEKRNTLPGCADAYVDMRYANNELGEALKSDILAVADNTYIQNPSFPDLPVTEGWAVLHRPVKSEHPKVDELLSQAMGFSALIGEPVVGARMGGGGTDGSIAQSVGLPTIDSMGIDSDDIHSSRETASVKSLIARTKLAAVMLARQIGKK